MANVRNQNTFFVDSASAGGTAASFIVQSGIRVAGIIFTSSSAADAITINDVSSDGTAVGIKKLVLKNINATDSKFLNLIDCPLSFANGIWISAISSSSVATLILANTG